LSTENPFSSDNASRNWPRVEKLETMDFDPYTIKADSMSGASTKMGSQKGMILPLQLHSIAFGDIKY